MPDIDTQIREYFDATSSPISVDDAVGVRLTAVAPITGRVTEHLRPGWLVGIAAVLALWLFGLLPWLPNGPDMGPVVSTPNLPVDDVASGVPGLGTLRWERITGDLDTLPRLDRVEKTPSGGFVSYEGSLQGPKVWRSEDGLTWTSDLVPELGGYKYLSVQEGWVVGENKLLEGGPPRVYRRTGDSFVRVQLESSRLPDIPAGLEWRQSSWPPLESAGITLIPGLASAEVPWGEIYGFFEVANGCGPLTEQCTFEPQDMWDEASETLTIHHPEGAPVIGALTIAVVGDAVTFTDAATGATMHTIGGTARYPADRIVAHVKFGYGLGHMGGWVSNQGGAFVWVDFPWSAGQVSALPDGGGFVAFELVWNPSGDTLVSSAVWTSPDGVEWTNRGEPPFVDSGARSVDLKQGLHEVWATVTTGLEGNSPADGEELTTAWTSIDGVTWTQVATPFPLLYSQEFETDFGFVVTAMPQLRYEFWVSTDRSTWHRVAGSPGMQRTFRGHLASSSAGKAIFVTLSDDETGIRTLWVGRFDSSP